MKRTIINGLIAGLSSTLLVACGGTTDSSSSGSKLMATTAACYATWSSSAVYTGGQTASYNGVNYTAAYWTQGQNPSTNNGPAGSGQPWISNGACGSTPTPTPAPTPTPTPAPTPTPTPAPTPTPTPAPTPTPTPAPTPAPTPTGSCPQYVSGHSYATGDKVTNVGNYYQCTVGGWCSQGGAYEPGVGWAWTNAWSQIAASQCSGTPTPTPAPTPAPTPTPTPAPTPAPTPTPTGWTLGWSDEFNGTSLDTSKWNYEVNCDGGGNNELECYTSRPENVSVSGGNLVITARQESYNGKPYTSGRINTSSKFSQTYGRMEARIKIPTGQGTWPAFWMLGQNIGSVGWPACGEIDIMEHVNTEAMVHGTIHWADQNGNYANYGGPSGSLDFSQYHVYAVEWDTNAIKWFVDGAQYWEANVANNINGTDEFHNPFFIIFNLAIGGNWPGSPNGSIPFPQQMLVDYVRVYHK